jgi:hypothetical protein
LLKIQWGYSCQSGRSRCRAKQEQLLLNTICDFYPQAVISEEHATEKNRGQSAKQTFHRYFCQLSPQELPMEIVF